MPLTEASKSKVSLASLSATTAAAAESLWSKSKKSSKRRQKSAPADVTPEVSSTVPSSNQLIKSSQSEHQLPLQQPQPVPVDRNEFRRKFLEGLQFYCENSSLILNSDLPADLIEFVTSHGFSVESLGIILELKKSSSAFSAYVDKKPIGDSSVLGVQASGDKQTRDKNFSEISRRLLQHWMNADSCAEAFVSLSLGEEIPGLIAECASFQRILFAVPDNFHLIGEDFLSFLLGQLLLAIRTLVYGVKVSSSSSADNHTGSKNEDLEPTTVRTQVVAQFLDRTFMRYFSDVDHFHSCTTAGSKRSSFQGFVVELADLCSQDVISRRLVSKILLHMGSHSTAKIVKVMFASSTSENEVASTLLWPSFEFLERNSQWKFILQTLPVKLSTKSKGFWIRWAKYIEKESHHFDEFWEKTVQHWIILNKSPLVDVHSLYSTSLAITALAKQIKLRILQTAAEKETLSQYIMHLDPGKILQYIIHSLESINEEKRACGMAIGQIVADLQFNLPMVKAQPQQNGEDSKMLKFDCKADMFIDLINFYETEKDWEQSITTSQRAGLHKVEVLDSDDDEDVPESSIDPGRLMDDGFPVLGQDVVSKTTASANIGIDPRILTLRTRKRKIPMYFSEIVETLLEKSKNEDENEILQYLVVLKIPVLLFMGVKIDSRMATTITRCLADLEDETSLKIPIMLALYELFMQHSFEVADVLAEVTFGRDHYALGQRLTNLTRLTKIVELSSKQICFNCLANAIKRHKRELLGIYPEFIEKYLHSRMKLRFCQQCRSTGQASFVEGEEEVASVPKKPEENKSLTWREIVDNRIAAKTKYFVAPRKKTVISIADDYSSKLFPILWASIANRLTSQAVFYMDMVKRDLSGNLHDIFLVKIFQFLARCTLGTSGPNCPHIRNVSSHAGELIFNYSRHPDASVRRAVFSLLGVTLSVGEGKVFVVEALSSQASILQTVDELTNAEEDSENRQFLGQIQQCLAAYTTVGLLKDLALE